MATPGRTARKPTLETVAARAGVSRSLVSLVLRNSPKVSAASREAVMRAVAELGYRPNAAARLLAERQSHTIGVLLNDLRQPWFADILANDNHLGGTLAVRHLIELGHARIAHIHGLPSVAGRLRMEGYEDTMRAAGLGGHVQVEAGDMSEEGGYRAAALGR